MKAFYVSINCPLMLQAENEDHARLKALQILASMYAAISVREVQIDTAEHRREAEGSF